MRSILINFVLEPILEPFLPGSGYVSKFGLDPDPLQIFFKFWIQIRIKLYGSAIAHLQ